MTVDDETFLQQELGVPAKWIAEAKVRDSYFRRSPSDVMQAEHALYRRDYWNQFHLLLEAQSYEAAHKVFMDQLASEILLRGDLVLLQRLLTKLPSERIGTWPFGGKVR